MLTRREFVAATLSMAALPKLPAQDRKTALPVVVATWDFGKKANAKAWEVLAAGGSALDAVEKGINDAELDPENTSVGYGGLPNEDGEVTLDAMIMDGKRHAAGAVACLKRIKTPISVARKVLEKTRHTLLVGEDATRFAVRMGFKEEDLLTEKAKKIWEAWVKGGKKGSFWNHDTIGMVAVDKNGDLAAGCSTSGLAWKIPGRVGDSPIVGSGAYCDNDVGAAAATGNGDVMMRFCPSLIAVEYMRAGRPPAEACALALKRIADKGYRDIHACLIAVSKTGEFGAATLTGPFPYAVRNGDLDEIRTAR